MQTQFQLSEQQQALQLVQKLYKNVRFVKPITYFQAEKDIRKGKYNRHSSLSSKPATKQWKTFPQNKIKVKLFSINTHISFTSSRNTQILPHTIHYKAYNRFATKQHSTTAINPPSTTNRIPFPPSRDRLQ
jgi:hypothetical protein